MKTNLKAARQKVFDVRGARKAVLEQMDAISAAAGDNALNAEQQKSWDEMKAKCAQLDKDLAAAEEKLQVAEDLNEAERTAPGISVRDSIEDKPWSSLGEQLLAVASASTPSGGRDPRLKAAASGASVGGDSGVSFLVQKEFSTSLIEMAMEESVLAPMCTPLTCGEQTDTVELPYVKETSRAEGSRFGGVQVYWRKEAATVTPKMPELGLVELPLEELMGLAYVTDRTLRDATLLESIFAAAFAAEFAFKIDDAIFRGDGVGKMLGMIASTGPRVEVTKETNQAADTVTSRNLSDMWVRMYSRSKSRAIWLVNSELSPQLDELMVPAGTSAVAPRIVTYNEAGVMRIKGRPVIELEQCSAPGDAGDIALVDPKRYLLLRKGALQSAQSMHVRFIYGENTYRWTQAINGRPADVSATTPYKGSKSRSAFVTLEAR